MPDVINLAIKHFNMCSTVNLLHIDNHKIQCNYIPTARFTYIGHDVCATKAPPIKRMWIVGNNRQFK